MDYRNLIIRDPEIMLGKPIIKGTRITVELIMRKLAGGYSTEEFVLNYPHISREQVLAALAYTADFIANEEVLEIV